MLLWVWQFYIFIIAECRFQKVRDKSKVLIHTNQSIRQYFVLLTIYICFILHVVKSISWIVIITYGFGDYYKSWKRTNKTSSRVVWNWLGRVSAVRCRLWTEDLCRRNPRRKTTQAVSSVLGSCHGYMLGQWHGWEKNYQFNCCLSSKHMILLSDEFLKDCFPFGTSRRDNDKCYYYSWLTLQKVHAFLINHQRKHKHLSLLRRFLYV